MSDGFSRGEHNSPENPTRSFASAMSRALIQASALKPEIRLAQAVSEFQADLSSEEKDKFQSQRSQFTAASPVFDDVMRLTAEVNRQTSRKFSGQCFGTRFTNFMHLVQQFAAIGDVVVGGSQNLIACGVWALVRMSILSIVSTSTYADKLSSLFMDIGRSTPRNQAMALLYPRSRKLQSYLAEYFVVVVNLCRYIYKFGQKSIYQQYASAMSDAKLQAFRGELGGWANSIKDEVSLLEKQEDAGYRALSRKMFSDASHKHKIATRLRTLNFCSTYDHQTAWKQIRKGGNASFFMKLSDYQAWRDCADSCTLVCIGQLGSGKSVMLANIIDDLTLSVSKERCVVTYFFCRYDVPESLKARTIFGSLARQMLSALPDLVELAESWDITGLTSNVEDIIKLVERCFPSSYKSYVVLDGLDECDDKEREIVLAQLQRIQKKFKVLVCASFRKEPNDTLRFTTQALVASRVLSMPDNNPDIESFIDMDLERCLAQNRLVIGDPALILEIQDALMKGSQGMFLWVALQIQSLCDMKTDQSIRDALADLPKDLSETFKRILHKSGGKNRSLQDKTLRLVIAARRPLTTEELCEALSVTPGDATWNPAKVLNEVHSALACCGCLLTIDEEELTVRVVHHSFRQFMLDGFDVSTNRHFTFYDAQNTMADIIVTYLGYNIFETQISTTTIRPMAMQSAPLKVIHATMGPSSTMSHLALKLLKSRKQPKFDMTQALAEARSAFERKSESAFKFYEYARSHWQDHILFLSGQKVPLLTLAESTMLRMPKLESVNNNFWLYCYLAVCSERRSVLELLLKTGKIASNTRNNNGVTLLMWASSRETRELLEVLLNSEHFDFEGRAHGGLTPLAFAAKWGYGVYLALLLETGRFDVNEESCGSTPLLHAVTHTMTHTMTGGHEDLVKQLLDTGKANVNAMNRDGWTPLTAAAHHRHIGVVKLLMGTRHIDVNASLNDGRTPLIIAARKGYKDIVKLLLRSERINFNAKNSQGMGALTLAAGNGHKDIVAMLLNTGKVDFDSKDNDGYTAIMHAVLVGDKGIVGLLLDIGADVNETFVNGKPLLIKAIELLSEDVAELMISDGRVDVNVRDKKGRTPLMVALMTGKDKMVERLLRSDNIFIDIRDDGGTTALMHAASLSNEEIVRLLLKTDRANFDAKDSKGWTALMYAVKRGRKEIVEPLLIYEIASLHANYDAKYKKQLLRISKNEEVTDLIDDYD